MTTANVGIQSQRMATQKMALYTTTTDQFGATVFQDSASPKTIVLDTNIVGVGPDLSYNNSTGVYSLTGNITYQLTAGTGITNYPTAADTPATLQWVNNTTGASIGPAFPANGVSNVAFYKPTSNTTLVLKVVAGTVPFAYPATLIAPRSAVQSASGWTE